MLDPFTYLLTTHLGQQLIKNADEHLECWCREGWGDIGESLQFFLPRSRAECVPPHRDGEGSGEDLSCCGTGWGGWAGAGALEGALDTTAVAIRGWAWGWSPSWVIFPPTSYHVQGFRWSGLTPEQASSGCSRERLLLCSSPLTKAEATSDGLVPLRSHSEGGFANHCPSPALEMEATTMCRLRPHLSKAQRSPRSPFARSCRQLSPGQALPMGCGQDQCLRVLGWVRCHHSDSSWPPAAHLPPVQPLGPGGMGTHLHVAQQGAVRADASLWQGERQKQCGTWLVAFKQRKKTNPAPPTSCGQQKKLLWACLYPFHKWGLRPLVAGEAPEHG